MTNRIESAPTPRGGAPPLRSRALATLPGLVARRGGAQNGERANPGSRVVRNPCGAAASCCTIVVAIAARDDGSTVEVAGGAGAAGDRGGAGARALAGARLRYHQRPP